MQPAVVPATLRLRHVQPARGSRLLRQPAVAQRASEAEPTTQIRLHVYS